MREVRLNLYGIIVTLDGNGGGHIQSDLRDGTGRDDGERYVGYIASVDAVEDMILAHACAGVDVANKRYVKGIEVALERISNEWG